MAIKTKKPTVATGTPNIPFKFPLNSHSFDTKAFDSLIRTQGVKIVHYRAIPDPTNLKDRGSSRKDDPNSDSEGYIYKEAGCFTGLFYSNETSDQYSAEGMIDLSNAHITPPRFYDNTEEPVIIDYFDRFYMTDIELRVVTSQFITTTGLRKDKASFPILCIEYVIGSDGFEYKEGLHFQIDNQGDIEWLTQKRPFIDPHSGKPDVYAIRYRYQPYWVVRRLIHEVRVSQVTNPQNGQRYVERLPYQVQVARENIFRDRNNRSNAIFKDQRFQELPPEDGVWSPDDSGSGN